MTTSNLPIAGATGPHQGQPILAAGAPLGTARAAVILIHGRGASAADIIRLADPLAQPGLAFLAPQASGFTWYPNSFLAPIASNEPNLSSALSLIAALIETIKSGGIATEQIVLLGFSQGACLALESGLRHPTRYGSIIALSGGLITPPAEITDATDRFSGTPILISGSDHDPHIPRERMEATADVLGRLGANVSLRIYPGATHTITRDELARAQALVADVTSG